MARSSKGIDEINASKKGENKSSVGTLKPEGSSSPAGSKTSKTPLLTHKQIEERARAIWRQKGCPVGQDEKIWCEAESQLKKEHGSK